MNQLPHVVCPHCDTVNRVPRAKLAAGGRCGACHQPLFEGRPVSLGGARFARHLDESDIPLLIDFWAPWCGPCQAMAPAIERAAGRLEPRVRLVKVNIDREPALAEQFGVRGIPTIVLALRGREIDRLTGARSEDDLIGWVLRQQTVVAGS
jgi:thioredoxin 2